MLREEEEPAEPAEDGRLEGVDVSGGGFKDLSSADRCSNRSSVRFQEVHKFTAAPR